MADVWFILSNSLILLLIISFIYSIHKKKFKEFAFSFLLVLITIELIKSAFKVPRPITYFDYSFISLHSALAFLAFYYLREFLVLIIWPILIAISRVKLNLHRIEDIILGAIYGFYISYIIDKNFKKFENNFQENKYYILRKLLHVTFYLSFGFLAFFKPWFLSYSVISILFIYIINLMKEEFLLATNPIFKTRKLNEDLKHTMFFPILSLLVYLIFENPYLILFSSLVFAIGDGLVGILAILTNNYFYSFLVTNFYLFLIVSAIFNIKVGFWSAVSFTIGDLIAKKLNINDNYIIPLVSYIVSLFFFPIF